LKISTLPRFAVVASLLSFAAFPVVTHGATFGPGGGIPSPIGQSNNIAFGPGGGIPSPIGQSNNIAFGPGGGIPSPIGQSNS